MKIWAALFLMLTWAGIEGFVFWGVPVLFVVASAATVALRLKLSPDYRAGWLARGWPLPGVFK